MPERVVREVAFEHPDSVLLRSAQRAEIAERYGRWDSEPGVAPTAADITVFVVAYDDGVPVACGGIRRLDETHGEIKRMFVTPAARGTGASVAVLSALEDWAREQGWDRLVLETGTAQPDAVRFYEREGYSRVPNFGSYAGHAESLCFGKALGG